jgi:hypothetical protein
MLLNFQVNHKLLYDQINRFTYGGINAEFSKNFVDYYLQSDVDIMTLKMKYPSNKLYIVTQTVFGATMHDLSVTKGTILGVIKTQDPMGDTSKWFVDNGLVKGFLERQYLELIHETKFVEENKNITCTNTSINLISLNSVGTEKNKHFVDPQNIATNIEKELNHHSSSAILQIKSRRLYKNVSEVS